LETMGGYRLGAQAAEEQLKTAMDSGDDNAVEALVVEYP